MKKRKVALLLLATLCVGLLGGCKGTDSTKPEDAIESEKPAEEKNSDAFSFPLAEKQELSLWTTWENSYLEDPNEMLAFQEFERATNVHINYTVVGRAEASEKYGLLLASGDYPDITMGGQANYPGGMEKAVEEGVYLDLTEYVKSIMPNYVEMMNTKEEVARDCTTDDHRYLQIYSINGNDMGVTKERSFLGLVIRRDWLEELKLEVPVTIEDWHKVLTAFKEEKGATAPLMIGKDGFTTGNAFLSAFGVLQEYYVEDGQVSFGPVTDGYRQYLELMRDWYTEGLLDPDFTANDAGLVMPFDYVANGKAGAGQFLSGWCGDYMRTGFGMTEEEDFYLLAVEPPVLNSGDKTYSNTTSTLTGVAAAVTSNCKNPELACRWLDYQYSEEGRVILNYGIEGETYQKDENGGYQWTDFVMNHPEGYTRSDAGNLVTSSMAHVGYYNWEAVERFDGSHDGDVSLVKDTWDKADTSRIYPASASMTDTEGSEYSTLYTDIETMVDEMTIKFITGTESLENFDTFVESLYGFGLQTCIDIKQAAYERYIERVQ